MGSPPRLLFVFYRYRQIKKEEYIYSWIELNKDSLIELGRMM